MSRRTQRTARLRGRAATTLACLAIAGASLAPGAQARVRALGGGGDVQVIVLPAAVRDSMNAMFTRYNKHWNELAETNTLAQMLGSGQPTQLEYMGCLRGRVARDTLWVSGWVMPRGMRQLQFAVTGDCDRLSDVVGTWHTHPYRADSAGHPLKERGLSATDLTTFGAGDDRAILALWDVDSLDAASRTGTGRVRHPAQVVVR